MSTAAFAASTGKKILCVDSISRAGMLDLETVGYTVHVRRNISNIELDSIIKNYCAVIVGSANSIRSETIENAQGSLIVIGRAGVGTDNIDIAAARRAGIAVVNAPNGNTVAVAELTFGLIITLSRNIVPAHSSMVNGQWMKSKYVGYQLQGKKLGIVGMGNIGKAVASRAVAFGMKVLTPKREKTSHLEELSGGAYEVVSSLEEMLPICDILSLHVPYSNATRSLIGKRELSLLKPSAMLINVSRGGVVNESDLLEALDNGSLKGAAIDVFEHEGGPVLHSTVTKLANHPSVICTPHLGAATAESGDLVMKEVCQAVKDVLEGKTPSNCLVSSRN